MYSGTDLFASLMMQIEKLEGGDLFVQRFWHHAAALPSATSTAGAVANWISDINYAGCRNLNIFFYDELGFSLPNGTTRPRVPAHPPPLGHGCVSATHQPTS